MWVSEKETRTKEIRRRASSINTIKYTYELYIKVYIVMYGYISIATDLDERGPGEVLEINRIVQKIPHLDSAVFEKKKRGKRRRSSRMHTVKQASITTRSCDVATRKKKKKTA